MLLLDVDRDGDLDVFSANHRSANSLRLNDRLWTYHDADAAWKIDDAGPAWGAASHDLNQDGLPDIALSRGRTAAPVALIMRSPAPPLQQTGRLGEGGLVTLADLDNDGDPDAVSTDPAGATRIITNDGTARARTVTALAELKDARGIAPIDLDGDGKLDLLCTDAAGRVFRYLNTTETSNGWLGLQLVGKRVLSLAEMWSNTWGVGAHVEVAAGNRRLFADTSSAQGPFSNSAGHLHIGMGNAAKAGYVRVVWPDLVLQSEMGHAAGEVHRFEEVNRKASSCPVLFKGDGKGGFEFVTDFLGVGGLGFFLEPGVYAQPDATETVRIGDVHPRDGKVELRIHEPMEEISYLDELRLMVVEHDADTEVFCDERLATAEPMPS